MTVLPEKDIDMSAREPTHPAPDATRRRLTAMLAAGAFGVLQSSARAADPAPRPTRPVRFVIPYAAGGSADVIGRLLAQGLSGAGYRMVVENKPGAGGHTGADYALQQPADGSTLVLATIAHNGAYKLYRNLRYDPRADLRAVVLVAESPNVLLVRNSLPVRTVAELLAVDRARPGGLNCGTAGVGSMTHMAAELFKHLAHVDMTLVPFGGGAPALAALLGEQVDLTFETGTTVQQALASGKVRALAVTTAARSPFYPGLPTIAEAGVPGYAAAPWYTVSVAARTPAAVVDRLNADLNQVIASAEAAPRWQALGLTPLGGSADDARRRNDAEGARWSALIDAAKLVAE